MTVKKKNVRPLHWMEFSDCYHKKSVLSDIFETFFCLLRKPVMVSRAPRRLCNFHIKQCSH
uniref:Uncharacterized protein n=1 Tax=Anguilla anguilla TaxID=7936 RepID=A0A0E9SP59_ANGAN